jgi:hypothetical protein
MLSVLSTETVSAEDGSAINVAVLTGIAGRIDFAFLVLEVEVEELIFFALIRM